MAAVDRKRDSSRGRVWERERDQAGGSPLLFRLTLPAFETRNFTHTHTYRWHLLIQAQKVCHEIWHNTAAAAAEGLSGVTWLPAFSAQLCSALLLLLGLLIWQKLAYRVAFFTHQMKMLCHGEKKLRKWRKVCSIFFNQISVNVTYRQRCLCCLPAAVLINNACKSRPKRQPKAHYKHQKMKHKWGPKRHEAKYIGTSYPDTLRENL